ncbi:VOC family protein [Paenalkalicoccus suaedae]|uniref:VOC family protein n=1 Tax=Paenalkalicoccus suaedae TaxID=2592382 RepID=A0A859F9Q3_9BACI|nr:VOC family protein [Paenalkalicoccus suaedae]QKS69913.1 VOC family protein [Paenalkalicoccus suaedae]
MFVTRLDHVQLAAPKDTEEIARKFYQIVLQFDEVEKPPALKENGGVWFQSGDVHLHIGTEESFTAAKKAHPGFEVEDLVALKNHLSKKNIPYIEDDKLPGANRIYVADPFGNRLEFLQWL